MQLKYHADTQSLIASQLAYSSVAAAALDSIEQEHGFTFPSALREWYSLQNACEILDEYSNADSSVLPRDMLSAREDTHGGGPHNLLGDGLIPIRYENQGVAVWAVKLDGTENPPVVVDVDTQFRKWQPCAASFSEYVFSCVWDYHLVMHRDAFACTDNIPFNDSQLEFLRSTLTEGPTTHGWPRDHTYRFSDNGQALVFWADEVADWHLGGATEECLCSLIATVGHLESLQQYLYSHTATGKRVLDRLKANRDA